MSDTDQGPHTTEPKATKPDGGEWPNTVRSRDELDSALEAGLKSGRSKRSIDEIMESAITRIENG